MAQIIDSISAASATVDSTKLTLQVEDLQDSDLIQTATQTTAAATVITLPAAGAGLFHYITSIDFHHVATAAAVVGTAVVNFSTTNLPGTLAWSTGNAAPVGQKVQDLLLTPCKPIKSSVANTATTITMGAMLATTTTRAVVTYFAAK